MAKKNENSENTHKKLTKKQRAELEKEILLDKQDKLEKAAQKIAMKAMTEMQLAQQVELTDLQKQVASSLASGKNVEEAAEIHGIRSQEISHWNGLPSFVRYVDNLTLKTGLADRNNRVRSQKRVLEEVYFELIKRIAEGGLENVPFALLSDLYLKHGERMDKLADKKEDNDAGKKDLTVLILHHVQTNNQKKYNDIDSFLEDPEFKFPTIDVESKEV